MKQDILEKELPNHEIEVTQNPLQIQVESILEVLIKSDNFNALASKLFHQFQGQSITPTFSSPSREATSSPTVETLKKIVKVETTPNWAKDFEKYQQQLSELQSSPKLEQLYGIYVKDNPISDLTLLEFICISGQWETVKTVWERLADLCKSERRQPTSAEYQLLKTAIDLYNFNRVLSKIELRVPQDNEAYNFKLHNRVNSKGEAISQVLLPALYDGKKLEKLALVITE